MIKEIKNYCKKFGIEFEKCRFKLNGNTAYRVRGKLYTKNQLIEVYRLGEL